MTVLAIEHPEMESVAVVLVVDNLHRILETQDDRIMYVPGACSAKGLCETWFSPLFVLLLQSMDLLIN